MATYRNLEPLTAPDSLTSKTFGSPAIYFFVRQAAFQQDIEAYVDAEASFSNAVAKLPKTTSTPTPAFSDAMATFVTELGVYQKMTDSVSADLLGYEQRIRDLGPCGYDNPDPDCKAPFAWPVAGAYRRGDLTSLGNTFYVWIGKNSCGQPERDCKAPSDANPDWLSIDPDELKAMGDYDADNVNYSAGNQVFLHGSYWTCVGGCATTPGDNLSDWVPTSIGSRQALPQVSLTSRQDDERVYQGMSTRTVTYSLDTLNLISNSQQAIPSTSNKKVVSTIVIGFADRPNKHTPAFPTGAPYTALRWEASAGVFFSWLPNRSFSLGDDGQPVDRKMRPTPVPFAAANYRLTGDFGTRWKQNVYMTFAVGVNPNNTTGEFGVGPSYSWRMFMVNFLCHFGHDTYATSNTPSGSSSSLPTATRWTEAPAIGISVRIPSLTGR